MPELPSAEEIRTTESKIRPLPLEPWVAAGFARLWQTMKINIKDSIVSDSSASGQALSSGTPKRSSAGNLVQPRTVQSEPASVRNRS
jgi:hypothetical protein